MPQLTIDDDTPRSLLGTKGLTIHRVSEDHTMGREVRCEFSDTEDDTIAVLSLHQYVLGESMTPEGVQPCSGEGQNRTESWSYEQLLGSTVATGANCVLR